MKMPFGKYEGKEISEIPKDYLIWLVKQPVRRSYSQQDVELMKEITKLIA